MVCGYWHTGKKSPWNRYRTTRRETKPSVYNNGLAPVDRQREQGEWGKGMSDSIQKQQARAKRYWGWPSWYHKAWQKCEDWIELWEFRKWESKQVISLTSARSNLSWMEEVATRKLGLKHFREKHFCDQVDRDANCHSEMFHRKSL